MLEKIAVGWESVENVFLANTSLRKPFILLGRHGVCKTTVAKQLSQIFGDHSFRFYDATKDDLVSIAGIPIPDKLAQGQLEFSRHDRSIWDAKVIVVDELTRASKENQNLWLEILEEKTCFGKPLVYEMLIATMNPDSYASTFKLDEALLDRFYAVIPVPELQKDTSASVYKKLIDLNLRGRDAISSVDLKTIVEGIRKRYEEIKNNRELMEGIVDYISNFFEIFLSQSEVYVSPRKAVQLTEEIAAFASTGLEIEKAAESALIYTLSLPLKIKTETLLQIHNTLKPLLKKSSLSEADKVRLDISKLTDTTKTLAYLRDNLDRLESNLPYDECDKLLTGVDAKGKELLLFQQILEKVKGHEEQKRKISGKIALETAERVGKLVSKLGETEVCSDEDTTMKERVMAFTELIRKMPLPAKVLEFLFEAENLEMEKIVQFIKEVTDGDKPETDQGLLAPGS